MNLSRSKWLSGSLYKVYINPLTTAAIHLQKSVFRCSKLKNKGNRQSLVKGVSKLNKPENNKKFLKRVTLAV